ncbi:hypothetical protein BAE44_0011897 [Dichanthelium oligosanthes]|uniref:Uncharacterized protein n=1 Tax=Dichanthelium oligosanthes TaxID=888268 RepID=A0A1E5VPL5_9POAL|nr:hypothetical protein BAE44_0011897 [Dichanthelium oligosanthes]
MGLWDSLLNWLRSSSVLYFSLFFKQEMELSLVGLQNAGKTSLVNAVAVCINSLDLRYIIMFALKCSFFFVFSGLESIKDREVCCYMISCKDSVHIDVVIDWLIKHSRTAK